MNKPGLCLLLLSLVGSLVAAEPPGSAALTNAADIHRLSRAEATLGRPAHLRGVVTYSDPTWNLVFLQDSSSGIFVSLAGDTYPTNRELIEIDGVTGDGSFLPVVTRASWKHVNVGQLPEPLRVDSTRYLGDLDCQWAELVGVVQQVELQDQSHLHLQLAGAGWQAQTFLPLPQDLDRLKWESLVDARISLRGVCGIDYQDQPPGLLLKTFVPSRGFVQIVEPRTAGDPFILPVLPLEALRTLSGVKFPVHRIHVRGVVTYHSGSDLVLQQATSALRLHGTFTNDFRIGDSLEAVGFLARGTFSPALENAFVRPASTSIAINPLKIKPGAVLWGEHDGQLLQMTGVFQRRSARSDTLLLLEDGILFAVSLPSTNDIANWAKFKPGELLRVTGICDVQKGPAGSPQSFGLSLRSANDVVRLPAIHVFSARQVLLIILVLSLAGGLILLWGVTLRRKVREQTRELANSLSLLTAALESTADGVLVVDRSGKVTTYNAIMASMLGAPREFIESRQDGRLLAFVRDQVKDPEAFVAKVRELYDNPEAESFDTLEFKDGRTFERFSRPQRLNGQCVGRVWCLRDVTQRKQAEARLQAAHEQLVEASHRAGMAEVATSVLHNVGNVLNSVNVSATLIKDRLRHLRGSNLAQAAELLQQHMGDLPTFLSQDPKGQKLCAYLKELGATLAREAEMMHGEIESLRRNLEHIKTIVAMQQSYARASGKREWLAPEDLMEQAVQISSAAYQNDQIRLSRDYQSPGPVLLDRHKVLQVLVNLLSNARHALQSTAQTQRLVTLSIFSNPANHLCLRVTDNGIGIDPANRERIFQQGFTTRQDGHGFGLHGSSNAAKEMNGSLSVQSDGPGRGASFTLELPGAPAPEFSE